MIYIIMLDMHLFLHFASSLLPYVVYSPGVMLLTEMEL